MVRDPERGRDTHVEKYWSTQKSLLLVRSREESDEEREHSVGTNAPQVFAFEDERMEDGHLDLGQSNEGPDPSNEGPDPRNEGPDLSNRGTDVPESGFLTSSLFSSIERGAPESLVRISTSCFTNLNANRLTTCFWKSKCTLVPTLLLDFWRNRVGICCWRPWEQKGKCIWENNGYFHTRPMVS